MEICRAINLFGLQFTYLPALWIAEMDYKECQHGCKFFKIFIIFYFSEIFKILSPIVLLNWFRVFFSDSINTPSSSSSSNSLKIRRIHFFLYSNRLRNRKFHFGRVFFLYFFIFCVLIDRWSLGRLPKIDRK